MATAELQLKQITPVI